MNDTQADLSAKRKRRVKLIKRVIIILFFVIFILPLLLCIYLLFRVRTLEKQVDELYQISHQREIVTSRIVTDESEAQTESSGQVSSDTDNRLPESTEDTQEADTAHAAKEHVPEEHDAIYNQEDFERMLAGMTIIEESKTPSISENVMNGWPKKVYLTFDDGPSYLTDDILDVLAQYDVKATFFVIGTDDPELKKMYKRIVDEGHTLGMHSYSHRYQDIYASQEAFAQDLNQLENLLYEVTGVIPKIYRFPGGSSNTVSPISMEFFIDYLKAKDVTYYDWNISSRDASEHLLSKDAIVRNSLYGIEENEETMILMHDIGDKITTLQALPEIIEALQDREIPLVAIDDETMPIQHILE